MSMTYDEFLRRKTITDIPTGFECGDLPSQLFEFQRDVVKWGCKRGRAALFEDCGLGKTPQQLAWADQVATRGPVLIVAPLCVGSQTMKEGEKFGIKTTPVTCDAEVVPGINITNYEKLHRFDLSKFEGVVLDESSILKSYDGATRNQIINGFARTKFKLACTATPALNDFMELGNHAEFLGVMSRTEMLATFFVHDGGETSKWRLKGHAESEFWKWLCSWAVNIRKPSDLGYDDGGFVLPELVTHEHAVDAKHNMDGFLFALPASSLEERRNARKSSLTERVAKAAEIANSDGEQWLIWCNLNSESEALTGAINGAIEIAGKHSDEYKELAMRRFIDGLQRVVVTKPSIAGFGLNLQHCSRMAFVGLSDSYEEYYQAVRRCWRFGQKNKVQAHIITSKLEGAVLANIHRKEADAQKLAAEMVNHMSKISAAVIHGQRRETIEYNPSKKMKFPKWLEAA